MTWKDRFSEWQADFCSVTTEERDSFTKDQWCDWCNAYETYVKVGGQRPPRRPPI